MNNLKMIRLKNNITQKEIAERLNISQQAYARYEADNAKINNDLANKIAKILNTDVSLLLDVNNDKEMNDNSIEEFLNKSYTSYHACKNACKILKENGFVELYENEIWDIKEKGKYFVCKNSSALIAFKVGDLSHYAFNIAACHTDSPSLKVKGNTLISSSEGPRINVERYGGLILYSLLDIPLKVAGRVLTNENGSIKEHIVTSDYCVNIPSLCIHHNPTVNDGVALKVQNDMLPLIGEAKDLYSTFNINNIIDADLYCVPFVKASYTGVNNEYLVASRIDNLTNLYAIVNGLVSAESKGINVLHASDNEEIGSLTKQGAESNFLINTLKRINQSLNKSDEEFYHACFNGLLASIDNGHAIHPAHPEKSDTNQAVYLNKGIVIKHHANYSTDGLTSALIKALCIKNNIPYQEYYNNSDVRCGSTIGNVTSSKLSMNSCDIGLGQLAMHSGIETVGRKDISSMIKFVKSFYETKFIYNKKDILLD